MAATQTFQHAYYLFDNYDGTATVSSFGDFGATTVSDEGGDGSLNTGESVYIDDFFYANRPYSGFTDGHGGVVCNVSSTSSLYLSTDQVYNPGDVITLEADSTFTFCYCKGTLIQTVTGERAVESLQIGDAVLNAEGKAVAVKWIGRQRRNRLFAALNDQLPIRIGAGALGDGLPTRDLYVSPDHAMLVEGCLVHASALVNGRTIERMTSWDGDVEYFHIETETHEIVLAEGAAAETFIDNVSRETFDNYAEYAQLYPNARPMVELDLPRICYARQLPRAIARKLDAVADQQLGRIAAAA